MGRRHIEDRETYEAYKDACRRVGMHSRSARDLRSGAAERLARAVEHDAKAVEWKERRDALAVALGREVAS